jgi:hypothetical protein
MGRGNLTNHVEHTMDAKEIEIIKQRLINKDNVEFVPNTISMTFLSYLNGVQDKY